MLSQLTALAIAYRFLQQKDVSNPRRQIFKLRMCKRWILIHLFLEGIYFSSESVKHYRYIHHSEDIPTNLYFYRQFKTFSGYMCFLLKNSHVLLNSCKNYFSCEIIYNLSYYSIVYHNNLSYSWVYTKYFKYDRNLWNLQHFS